MNKNLIFVILVAAVFGVLFFAYQQEIIILNIQKRVSIAPARDAISKKNIYLYYLKDGNWQRESIDLIWNSDPQITAGNIASSWVTWGLDEKYFTKRITVQSAVVTPTNELYISFDRSPFGKEQSTWQKCIFIESLLKTIRESGLPVRALYFLINYQELQDAHLDFSIGWPISGFFLSQDQSCN